MDAFGAGSPGNKIFAEMNRDRQKLSNVKLEYFGSRQSSTHVLESIPIMFINLRGHHDLRRNLENIAAEIRKI